MATTTTPRPRTSEGAARFGFVVAVLVNGALLYAANVWPGWQMLPFLDADFPQVLTLINLSLVVSIVANVAYLTMRSPWVRPLGDLVTLGIGLAVLVRMWQVFPFDFGDSTLPWAALARVALAVGMAGTVIGLIAQLVTLIQRPVGQVAK